MKKLWMLIGALLILSLTACGGGGPTTNLNVQMTDFMYNPTDFTVPVGQEITLDLSNNGAVVHDFIIMKLGADAGDGFGDLDEPNMYWKAELQPGTSETFTFTAPDQPGEYQVLCGIPGHYVAGMVAKLIVVSE